MANKVYVQAVIQYLGQTDSAKRPVFIGPPEEISLAGFGEASGGYTATTAAAAIPVPSGTLGLAFIRNLDADNYVQLGWDVAGTFTPSDKIPAGRWTLKWLDPSRTWQWRANTASCNMQIAIYPA
jgi:hypothetical protein